MAIIKSFTDIEQSTKLAEILPIESADMYWWYSGRRYYIEAMNDGDFNENSDIRAWSLAALLDILPTECECMSLEYINYGGNKKYYMSYVGGENTEDYDNPIDACVAMIIKLHEQNLL